MERRASMLKCGCMALLGATVMVAGGPSADAAEYATHIVIYQDRKDQMNPAYDGFKKYFKEKTGQEIEITNFSQSGGQLQATIALEAMAGAVKADIIMTSPAGLKTMEDEAPEGKLFEDYIPEALNDAAVIPGVKQAAKELPGIIYDLNPYAIVYNTKKVAAADVPKSWLDILDPKWSGKIGLGDVEQTSGSRAPLWFLIKQMEGKPGFGWEFYEKLGKLNPRQFDSHNTLVDLIAAGELDLGIAAYSHAYRAFEKGEPVALALPIEGAGSEPTSVAIVKSRPEDVLNTAKLFMDFIAGQEGQRLLYEGIRALPIRTDVDLGTPPFAFDVKSPTIVVDDPHWISTNSDESVEKFREYIR